MPQRTQIFAVKPKGYNPSCGPLGRGLGLGGFHPPVVTARFGVIRVIGVQAVTAMICVVRVIGVQAVTAMICVVRVIGVQAVTAMIG
jgi:hypothetical protein